MSRSLHARVLANIVGIVGFVVTAVMAPSIETAAEITQAETICLPPQYNDPWIGCTG